MSNELCSGAKVSSVTPSKKHWQWRPMRWKAALMIMGIVLAAGSAMILFSTGDPMTLGGEPPDDLLLYNFNVMVFLLFAVWTTFSEREWPVWKRVLWIIGLWLAHGFMQIIPFGNIMDRLTGGLVTNPTTVAIILTCFAMRRSTFFVELAPPDAKKQESLIMFENKDQGDRKLCQEGQEDKIDLFALWQVIWRRRVFIACIVCTMVAITALSSLFMPNIYSAKAIIMPVDKSGGGIASSLMQQMGGLSGLIGLADSASSTEIVLLLHSDVLREKILKDYNLIPVFVSRQRGGEKKAWKTGQEKGFTLNAHSLLFMLIESVMPANKKPVKKDNVSLGLLMLATTVKIDHNVMDKTITISAESDDPVFAANIVNYFLTTLNNHMSSEAKRVTAINKHYLEDQLLKTADPLIKQKLYNMIAQQVETSMLAEVKENFCFKIIDPPRVPDEKIKPQRSLMVLSSFLVSLFLGVMIVFFLEFLEKIKKLKAARLKIEGSADEKM
jgi:capsular polysaccharide biosynthesis protein